MLRTPLRKFGNCNSYNGSSGKTIFSTNPTGVISEFTLATWIKPNGLPQNSSCIMMNGNDSNGYGIFVGDGAGGSGTHLVALNATISWVGAGANSNALTDATWQHVALARRASAWYLYINGVEKNSGYSGAPGIPTSGRFSVGCQLDSGNAAGRFFNGQTDFSRAWNVGLTQQQIFENYIMDFVAAGCVFERKGTILTDPYLGIVATDTSTSVVTSNTAANITRTVAS